MEHDEFCNCADCWWATCGCIVGEGCPLDHIHDSEEFIEESDSDGTF
ncbi:MAG: hypothetical protein GY861_21955 [bacterium]|nr:hypothetical protein [bacterium]